MAETRAPKGSDRSEPAPDLPAQAVSLAQLVTEHHAVLYRYAYRLSGSTADAEDLTQQAFLIAQQKLDQVRDPAAGRSWLFTVLRNCFLKTLRRQVPVSAGDVDLDINSIPEKQTDRETFAEVGEIDREQLQAAIDELSGDFRVVLMMYYFEEHSYREIAEQLELPLGTVMSRLSRAKGHLRSRLLAEASDASRDTKKS